MIKKILATLLALFMAAAAFATEVNTASQAELDAVKGIGPALSARIVDARKTGTFKDWGDLVSRVKGIGDKNSAEFSAGGLTVNGSAKAGAPVDAAAATRKADKAGAKAAKTGSTAPVASTTPAATSTTATAPAAATAPVAGSASAPMSAADKKAAKKAAKEEKARLKAANGATGAASAASTPAKK